MEELFELEVFAEGDLEVSVFCLNPLLLFELKNET